MLEKLKKLGKVSLILFGIGAAAVWFYLDISALAVYGFFTLIILMDVFAKAKQRTEEIRVTPQEAEEHLKEYISSHKLPKARITPFHRDVRKFNKELHWRFVVEDGTYTYRADVSAFDGNITAFELQPGYVIQVRRDESTEEKKDDFERKFKEEIKREETSG